MALAVKSYQYLHSNHSFHHYFAPLIQLIACDNGLSCPYSTLCTPTPVPLLSPYHTLSTFLLPLLVLPQQAVVLPQQAVVAPQLLLPLEVKGHWWMGLCRKFGAAQLNMIQPPRGRAAFAKGQSPPHFSFSRTLPIILHLRCVALISSYFAHILF